MRAKRFIKVLILSVVAIFFVIISTEYIVRACAGIPPWDYDQTLAENDAWYLINATVGIGTQQPDGAMHIFTDDPMLTLDFNYTPTVNNAELVFSDRGNPGAMLYWDRTTDKVYLENLPPSVEAGTMIALDNDGNVGIGTDNPQKMLHVAGDIQVDGNINAKYQDLAEWVKTSKPLTAGTVVMIDPKEINQVIPSDTEYNTLVSGVVSETPGILLGEEGSDKAVIAHTGRVKVKVDTNYGAIKTGDLLVTSPVKGHAMKSKPIDIGGTKIHRPGTIIGKALEPLSEGKQGEILALITLQ